MRGKACKQNWRFKKAKLGLSVVFFSCLFFFTAGLFASNLLSQGTPNDHRLRARLLRQLHSVVEEEAKMMNKYHLLPNGQTGDDFISVIPFQVLSRRPRALYYPGFATAEQCQRIIKLAEPGLKPSIVALRKGETSESTKGIRTSSGVFIFASEDTAGVLDAIEEKIARATMVPRSHGEAFNVLRYEIGQKYDAHYDAFNPVEYGPQPSQRVATFLLYLSDFEEGGETTFPIENDVEFQGYDAQKCNGLRVKPRQGDGILFYSIFPNNTIDPTMFSGEESSFADCLMSNNVARNRNKQILQNEIYIEPMIHPTADVKDLVYFKWTNGDTCISILSRQEASLHASCPVIKGQKWVATKWIRDQEQV